MIFLFLNISHGSFIVKRVQSILTMQYMCVCMYVSTYFVYLHVQINLTRVEIWKALRYVHKCTSMFMYTCVDVLMYAHVCAWVGVDVSVSACACIRVYVCTCTCAYILHYSYVGMQHKFCLCAVKELIMTDQLVYVLLRVIQ